MCEDWRYAGCCFFPFFPPRLPHSFTYRVFLSVMWWKASISAFSAFPCISHSKWRFYFFPNTRLCEINCGLCLITIFFSFLLLFLLCLSFGWFCVVMLIILSCRVEREQYLLVKLDEFSFMGIICKTPMGGGRLLFAVRHLLCIRMSNLLHRWVNCFLTRNNS